MGGTSSARRWIPLASPSSDRCGSSCRWKTNAINRLPYTFILRQAAEEPKFLLRWYALLAAIFIPVYYVNWAVSEVATWFGVVVLWSSLIWSLSARIAGAIVFPGGLNITSRRFEASVAVEVKRRIEELVKEITFRCGSGLDTSLPKNMVIAVEVYLTSMLNSMSQHVKTTKMLEKSDKAESCISSLQLFLDSVRAWTANPQSNESRQAVVTSGNTVLQYTDALLNATVTRAERKAAAASKSSAQIEPASSASPQDDSDSETEPESDDNIENAHHSHHDEEHSSSSMKQGKNNKYKLLWTALAHQIKVYLDSRRPFHGIISYDWARVHLEMVHDGDVRLLNSHGYLIDTCFFRRPVEKSQKAENRPAETSSGTNDRPDEKSPAVDGEGEKVVVMCNPNAARYEQYALHPFWIDFYRSRGMNVLIWNFRGYGRSEGSPSPSVLKQDVETVLHHLIHERQCRRICFHGESIGGIAGCHAVSICGPHALLIADRTFASLDEVARALVGPVLTKMMNFATGWVADNVTGFLAHANPRNRLMLQDPQDEIVRHRASLKIGVARRLFKVYESPPQTEEEAGSAKFTRQVCDSFTLACERLALASSRPDFSCEVEQVEMSHGERISFLAFPDEFTFKSANDFVRVLLNLDGGHGQLFGRALMEEMERRKAECEYQRSMIGRYLNKIAGQRQSRGATITSEINHVWDWFASAAVYKSSSPATQSQRETSSIDYSIQVLQRIASQTNFTDPIIVGDVQTVLKGLEAFTHLRVDRMLPDVLLSLKCGHNGTPSKKDLTRIERFLSDAGWF